METSSKIQLLEKLKLSSNLSDEVVTLETLQSNLRPVQKQVHKDSDLDEEWLSLAVENLGEDDDDDDDMINP